MHSDIAIPIRFSLRLVVPIVALTFSQTASAQTFKPGDVVEYKVGFTDPEKWERGTVVRVLDGGKQYLIREKPSQFFPEGSEKAYSPSSLRTPGAVGASKAKPDDPKARPGTTPMSFIDPTAPLGDRPLTRAEVVAYTKQLFGPGDPFADGRRRDTNQEKIRDLIKARGVDFPFDDAFRNREMPNGTYSIGIGSAVEANYGNHPKLKDYVGTFLLRTTNRGTKTATPKGSQIVITTTDAQFEAGSLIITGDGEFIWKIGRNDPQEKWAKGKWREAKEDEKQPWEGGLSLVLLKARQNEDYTVRACRVPGYEGWIDIGMGKGRIAAHYGRPAK